MYSSRKNLFADDLLIIIDSFNKKSYEVYGKLGEDIIINQGLFLMTTSLFENSIRDLMRVVLTAYPEKIQSNTMSISKKQICEIANRGYNAIIDYELYSLFKNGVREQLEYLLNIIIESESSKYSPQLKNLIVRISDIYLFRNSLIHNGGKADAALNEKAKIYKTSNNSTILFKKDLIERFISDFQFFFSILSGDISGKYNFFNKTRLGRLRQLWKDVFTSPILQFDDYWFIDVDNDLITGINYPKCEEALSSSEVVLLSIWRHQYYDCIKTEQFLLCSINYDRIYEIYKGLDNLKFYHMQQEADSLGLFKITPIHTS